MDFKDLFKKEEKEKEESFGQFYREDLAPMLPMMVLADISDLIGINSGTLNKALNGKKSVYAPTIITDQINTLINKIDAMIEDEEFKKKIKIKLLFVRDYGKCNVEGNKITGTFDEQAGRHTLEIIVGDSIITFSAKLNDNVLSGKFVKTKEGKSYIVYTDVDTTIYVNIKDGHKDNSSDSYNIETETTIQTFDKSGIQTFEYNEKKRDNYFKDKNTGEITLHKPDSMENYIIKEYSWRILNKPYIIKRIIEQYVYPETVESFIPLRNKDSYLIGYNIRPDEKRLPFGGNYMWIDKVLYDMYKNEQCNVQEVWNNQGKKYPVKSK